MAEPPSGFGDMLGDAQLAAVNDLPLMELDVPQVGAVQARRPKPRAVYALAASSNSRLEDLERHEYLTQFVLEHLGEGEWERLLDAMLDGDVPVETLELVARALATWGNERPYVAVVNLAFTAAFHWRAIRTRLRNNGINDPMALPHMHALLDEAEGAVLEQLPSSKDKGYTPKPGQMTREEFLDRLYRPEPSTAKQSGDGPTVRRPPAWWGGQEQANADFNGFAAALRGG